MTDVAVATEAEALVQGLRRGVLLGLEAREDCPGEREDPEQRNEPRQHPETGDGSATFADAELRAAPLTVGHARASSLNKLESTRRANVAMMIEKTTTTIAYADAAP